MSLLEFDIIKHYFQNKQKPKNDILLNSGDDCAAIEVPADQALLLTMDTLVAGKHFPDNTDPFDIGYKALAVNLSDLAACGALPRFMTLSLTLPNADASWLQKFSDGLFTLANQLDVSLIGGDLTQGPLSITIQAHGICPKNKILKRSGAKLGELICVTGHPGHAGVGLKLVQKKIQLPLEKHEPFLQALRRPAPRVAAGILLREFATSAIDVSDGLIQDLSHIIANTQFGANVNIDTLPIQAMLEAGLSKEYAIHLALTNGDDYELCFTLPVDHYDTVFKCLSNLNIPTTVIGQIITEPGIRLFDDNDQTLELASTGFQHFKE